IPERDMKNSIDKIIAHVVQMGDTITNTQPLIVDVNGMRKQLADAPGFRSCRPVKVLECGVSAGQTGVGLVTCRVTRRGCCSWSARCGLLGGEVQDPRGQRDVEGGVQPADLGA